MPRPAAARLLAADTVIGCAATGATEGRRGGDRAGRSGERRRLALSRAVGRTVGAWRSGKGRPYQDDPPAGSTNGQEGNGIPERASGTPRRRPSGGRGVGVRVRPMTGAGARLGAGPARWCGRCGRSGWPPGGAGGPGQSSGGRGGRSVRRWKQARTPDPEGTFHDHHGLRPRFAVLAGPGLAPPLTASPATAAARPQVDRRSRCWGVPRRRLTTTGQRWPRPL